MGKTKKKNNKLGLVGRDISYSFSSTYFQEKFKQLGLKNYSYQNFDLEKIESILDLQKENLMGFNVTIPYKESIIKYLDKIDKKAAKIGAVNTVKLKKGKLIGYNTDVYGFKKSLEPWLKAKHKKALILGTGGASKAIKFVLKRMKIPYVIVSRNPVKNQIGYREIDQTLLKEYQIIINCTPVGTFPNIEEFPTIDYDGITADHLLFDLIYNPVKSAFLKKGEEQGATIVNGYRMLELQAEKSWKIWHD